MFCYTAYNLCIGSELRLPELTKCVSPVLTPDVVFRFGSVEPALDGVAANQPHRWVNKQGVCIYRPDVGSFAVQAGREVVIDPLPSVDEPTLRLFLLGPALALLLHQRDLFVLHASAVGLQGKNGIGESYGAAFLGYSGEGKSTTAAALHKHGYNFVADDLIAVDMSGSPPQILPGYPQLKLYPAAAATALDEDWEALPRAQSTSPKRARLLDDGFDSAPLNLTRIYILAYGDTERIEVLSAHEAVVELIRHTYGVLYAYSAGAEIHLKRCTQLATKLKPRRLVRRRDMARMNHLVEMIRHDLESLRTKEKFLNSVS